MSVLSESSPHSIKQALRVYLCALAEADWRTIARFEIGGIELHRLDAINATEDWQSAEWLELRTINMPPALCAKSRALVQWHVAHILDQWRLTALVL
jgi:hypothetical protein